MLDVCKLLGREERVADPKLIGAAVAGKVVLITGAGGSIGSELYRRVLELGAARVIGVERDPERSEALRVALREVDGTTKRFLFPTDVEDSEALKDLVIAEGPDLVIHAAASKFLPWSEEHPEQTIRANVLGTACVVEACLAAGTRRCVLISTDKAVNPTSVMGATKRLAEMVVRMAQARALELWLLGRAGGHCDFAAVRFGNVLGSRGSVLEVWARQLAEGKPLTVTDPEHTRWFMTLAEAVGLVLQAAGLMGAGDTFVADMGEPVRILDLARRFADAHQIDLILPRDIPGEELRLRLDNDGVPIIRPMALPVCFTGGRAGEKATEELVGPGENRGEHAVAPWIWRLCGWLQKVETAPVERARVAVDLFRELAARGAPEAEWVEGLRAAVPEWGKA